MNYDRKIKTIRDLKLDFLKKRVEQIKNRDYHDTDDEDFQNILLNQDDYNNLPLPEKKNRWDIISNHKDGSFYGLDGWTENYCWIMEHHPVYVNVNDAFAGRCCYFINIRKFPHIWNPDHPYTHLEKDIEKYAIYHGIGGDAHFAPDFKIGLELGWKGLIEKINYYKDKNGPKKHHFYDCHLKVIKATQKCIQSHIISAKELYNNTEVSPVEIEKKQALRELIECNEAILQEPPKTFRQVLQWIVWFNLATKTYNRDGAGTQLDELLRPYYECDVANGILDDENAIYYLACFLLNDTRYNQLAGPHPETGEDLTSKVTFLILEAASKVNTSINLTVRVHDKINEEFFKKSVESLIKYKNGWPRFSGDKALVEGFMKNGYPIELARQRIATGCNWMSLPGLEYTLNDIVKINVAKVFELAFKDMISGNTAPSIDSLWTIIKKHLQKAIDITITGIRHHLKYQKYNEPELILNLLSHGPIEKGLDMSDGGAEYYNIAIDGSGLATFADSMAALEQRIENESIISWEEINSHLNNNWTDNNGERIRHLMLNSDRYGQGNSLGDKWAVKITEELTKSIVERSDRKICFIPGWFSWALTTIMGHSVDATPDGRRNGDPISHGANPNPGFSKDGASTALALSIAKVQPYYGNTAPMQIELDPSFAHEDQLNNVCSLIKTHFELGGTLININIIDKDKLLDAHKHPEKYPELVVRVTGFTAYFSVLTEEFRQLVVDRILTS
jgi:pyruvate-formate lyase